MIVRLCEWKFLHYKFALCSIWFFKAWVYLFPLFLIYKEYSKPWRNFLLKVILFTNFESDFIKFLKFQVILWYKFYNFWTCILFYKNKSLQILFVIISKLHGSPCMQITLLFSWRTKKTFPTPLTHLLITKLSH